MALKPKLFLLITLNWSFDTAKAVCIQIYRQGLVMEIVFQHCAGKFRGDMGVEIKSVI